MQSSWPGATQTFGSSSSQRSSALSSSGERCDRVRGDHSDPLRPAEQVRISLATNRAASAERAAAVGLSCAYQRPHPSLDAPHGLRDQRAYATLGYGIAAIGRPRQVEHGLLDVRCEAKEVHHLRDPGAADSHEPGERGLVGGDVVVDERVPAVRGGDPKFAHYRFRRGTRGCAVPAIQFRFSGRGRSSSAFAACWLLRLSLPWSRATRRLIRRLRLVVALSRLRLCRLGLRCLLLCPVGLHGGDLTSPTC